MSKKMIIIVIAAVVLILGMMGGGFFLMWQKMSTSLAQIQSQNSPDKAAAEEAAKAEKEAAMGPIYKMDTLIVNLADQGGKRYLRITMELEVSNQEAVAEIDKRLPQLRDAILMVLPSKQYADISGTEGKIALRDELIAKMNAILKTGKINTIYFTEFVVQ